MTTDVLDAPASTEIAEYSPTAAALVALRNRLENVAYDLSTGKGIDIAKRDRAEIRDLRVSLEKKRVELKAPALERSRLIDSEAKALTTELVALEKPIDDQIKAEERRKEAEKAAKKQAERDAAARVQIRIDAIRRHVADAVNQNSAVISAFIDALSPILIALDEFGERAGEAQQAKAETLTKLEEMRCAAFSHESEQARIAAEREELARQRAEQEARDKTDRARRDEEDRKAREIRAAEDRRQADARAELEAQQRAVREAEEANADAARKVEQEKADKAAAAERQRLDKIAAAERAEALRLESERAAKVQAEYDALIKAAGELKRMHDAAPAGFAALQGLVNEPQPLGIERPTYQAAVAALALIDQS